MPDDELLERVRELRARGRSPKEIARALKVPPRGCGAADPAARRCCRALGERGAAYRLLGQPGLVVQRAVQQSPGVAGHRASRFSPSGSYSARSGTLAGSGSSRTRRPRGISVTGTACATWSSAATGCPCTSKAPMTTRGASCARSAGTSATATSITWRDCGPDDAARGRHPSRRRGRRLPRFSLGSASAVRAVGGGGVAQCPACSRCAASSIGGW
jgi:hypothetical protein